MALLYDVPAAPAACSTSGRDWSSQRPGPCWLRPLPSHLFAKRFRRGPACAASSGEGRPVKLDLAALEYAKAVSDGADEEEVVAAQLGAEGSASLTDVQSQYKDKIREKLADRAEELRREKEARAVKFAAGKEAYGRGNYPASVALLEGALNQEGPFTPLGGEIQLWLALAYQACGRETECIDMYKAVERTHPLPSVRRQAAGLRYIMEAPKLELAPDEKVSIPLLTDLDPNRGGRSVQPRRPPAKRAEPKSWDEEFWDSYAPPKYLTNRYVWAAAALVMICLAWYSAQLH